MFFALAAIVLLYFSNRLYVKKSVIGYRTHMAYYQEANSMRYCGMIGLLAAVLFVKAWIGFTLLAFVAAIFHLFVFKKIKKHKKSMEILFCLCYTANSRVFLPHAETNDC